MDRYRGFLLTSLLLLLATTLVACAQESGVPAAQAQQAEQHDGRPDAAAQEAFADGVRRIRARAQTMDDALHPVPLLRAREEAALRRYVNRDQLERARQLGVPPSRDGAALEALQQAGRLVRLADSTRYWVVRELDHSHPFVTPDAHALLTEIGERFQARLAEMGLPPLRVEVTSALRTAASQAALRSSNENAARGTSTHEYGTTFDLAYSSFAAPADPIAPVDTPEAPWVAPYLHEMAALAAETVAARRSRELQAILGKVLRALQDEGKVMVTLERLQPVYHMTVAQRY